MLPHREGDMLVSELVQLFEKDPSFWKEWQANADLALQKRQLQPSRVIHQLRTRDYLKLQHKLFAA